MQGRLGRVQNYILGKNSLRNGVGEIFDAEMEGKVMGQLWEEIY